MPRFVVLAAALAIALGGCAHNRTSSGGATITYTYEPAPLCLRCRGYTVTLGSDGQGILVLHDPSTAKRRFQVTSSSTRNYATALAWWRPRGERLIVPDRAGCRAAPTDGSIIDVRWQLAAPPPAHLRLYSDCPSRAAQRSYRALRQVPARYLPASLRLGDD